MFVNNGDGTYTVRFYGGNGAADYVTVNSQLVVYAGSTTLAYADFYENAASTTLSLWIPLAEKAYAEWNQTGNEGRDGTNTYNSIQGGWMAVVCQQVLGYAASDYNLTASTQQTMINALAAHEAVTIGTDSGNNAADTLAYGLYGDHAYGVIGYNSSTGMFTLYNPWGMDQPQQVTWTELGSDDRWLRGGEPSNSVPIPGANKASALAAAAGASASSTVSAVAGSRPAAVNLGLWSTDPAVSSTATSVFTAGGDSDDSDIKTCPRAYTSGSTQDQSPSSVHRRFCRRGGRGVRQWRLRGCGSGLGIGPERGPSEDPLAARLAKEIALAQAEGQPAARLGLRLGFDPFGQRDDSQPIDHSPPRTPASPAVRATRCRCCAPG